MSRRPQARGDRIVIWLICLTLIISAVCVALIIIGDMLTYRNQQVEQAIPVLISIIKLLCFAVVVALIPKAASWFKKIFG